MKRNFLHLIISCSSFVFVLALSCLCSGQLNAQTISATTYPFVTSSGVALEDLSVGATTLVGADSDDGASAVTNIGFDF